MLTLGNPKGAKQRTDGSWKPGQSGNPRGASRGRRAYEGPSVAELARVYTHDAVKTLVIALHHPRDRVTAAIALLDRGWGKPQQNIHTQSEQTVLHLIAAQAISEEILASVKTNVSTTQIEGSLDANELPKE